MVLDVVRFIRLPLVLIFIFTVARFSIGLAGVPYAPRGNAMFSVLGLMLVSGVFYGAMSKKVGGFGWLGTILIGLILAEWGEILIWIATFISYQGHLTNSYFIHWDSLNMPEGTPVTFQRAMIPRTVALATAPIAAIIMTCIGRLAFGPLAPTPNDGASRR